MKSYFENSDYTTSSETKKRFARRLKTTFTIVIFLVCVINHAQSQDKNASTFSFEKCIQPYIQYNFNWSPTTSRAFDFWAFYDYRGPKYFAASKYYPLLEQLNGIEGNWTMQPQPEIGVRICFEEEAGAFIGANFALTRNVAHWAIANDTEFARAELDFESTEWRFMLQPTLGVRTNKFSFNVNLIFGIGFDKNYSTSLTVYDENNNVSHFSNDNDFFYNVDYSVGTGFGGSYNIFKNTDLIVCYSIYRVNTGPARSDQLLDFSRLVNGYWNNSVSLGLAYRFYLEK